MSTSPEDILAVLRARLLGALKIVPPMRRYLIAYSGGLDSTVLLYLMAGARPELTAGVTALHVNHGLHPAADAWAAHCQRVCERLGVGFVSLTVDARASPGDGPEASARRARYAGFASLMEAGDCLLTAHHRDDQAETLLLQLMRGAGPHGLAAMPPMGPLGDGWHVRPLLGTDRADLQRCAERAGLDWIQDPSNSDTRLRRNFLRHEIIPRLRQQWPALARTLSRSAAHCASAASLMDEVAAEDLARLTGSGHAASLPIMELQALSPARRDNLLRFWIHRQDLPAPATVHLERLRREVMEARTDASPLLAWPGAEIRRFRGRLYAMRPQAPFDARMELAWNDLSTPLELPDGSLLSARPAAAGLRAEAAERGVLVRFRRGGESCGVIAGGGTQPLKKLFQQSAVPPWLRQRIPLLFVASDLVAVPGVCVGQRFRAAPGERAWHIEWWPASSGSSRLPATDGLR